MFSELAKVIKKYPKINCQVSFEQFMGCGLGVCCGCTIETKNGYKKVCKDGPVFNLKEI
jgi:dihydroorotate dehydrogenase electron transfer subunit